MLVELLAVVEFLAQPRTDVQPVARIQAEVTVVEQRVHVGPQQPVLQPVVAALGDRPDMGDLQGGPDLRAGNRASALVSHQHPGLEGLLAEPTAEPAADHRRPAPAGSRLVESDGDHVAVVRALSLGMGAR